MSDVSSEDILSISEPSTVKRDLKAFSKLVNLAEEVQACRERIRRRLFFAMSVCGGLIFVAAIAMVNYVDSIDPREYSSTMEFLSAPLVVGFFSVILALYFAFIWLFHEYRRQTTREARALSTIMSVVHEVLQSSEMHMSPLEIAQVKIRLSRLDN